MIFLLWQMSQSISFSAVGFDFRPHQKHQVNWLRLISSMRLETDCNSVLFSSNAPGRPQCVREGGIPTNMVADEEVNLTAEPTKPLLRPSIPIPSSHTQVVVQFHVLSSSQLSFIGQNLMSLHQFGLNE
jgi:hypothetical protein